MFKALIHKYYAISAKMSLGAIALFVIFGVYHLPGAAIKLKNQKNHTDNHTNPIQNQLAQTGYMDMSMKLVSANNQFAFQLFSEIHKSQSNENIFISPSSIAIALSMTYNGASGKTQEAMAKTLNFQGMSLEEVNQANKELATLLDSLNPEIELDIGNSIWAKKGISFDPSFLQRNQYFYQSKVSEIDFDHPQTPDIINNWVKDCTEGKIDQIIDKLEPDSVMVLLNAIYFKADWEQEFSEKSTKELPFYLLNGRQKKHPIMFQSSEHLYYEDEDFQAVSLPYGEGRVSMYIFLPAKQVGLENFYQILNARNWQNWMLEFEYHKVNLGLPKFKTEYEVTLNNVLKSLGMEIAFDKRAADFSGMRPTPPELYIDEVKHKTFVEVNEKGTEAAATTSITMGTRSAKIVVDMLVNRPFFFAIRDNDSGTILFMGEITNPKM
ncbi:MAG: serpin family protein [Okeania sp. SIO3I5]|uniref:serpin family protein n=1 Tax=Okeania sp. SIO3I5 TaxID=2607805 RepID=UPI0013B76482|nr:serpin family protein [Okeania sp. SIO3I5]NEQ41269.1 serpin family protein [Okeania sp. SIO3I5]